MLGAVVLSPEALEPIINEMGQKYNIEPALIKAIIKTESNWDVNAARYEVHKTDSSWGLMQLMLATARNILGDQTLTTTQIIQPRVNIEAGTKLMAENWRRWGNLRDAVAAYNAGSPRLGKDGKYVNSAYVDKVWKNYNIYKTLGTGTAAEIATTISDTATDLVGEGMTPVYVLAGLVALGIIFTMKPKQGVQWAS